MTVEVLYYPCIEDRVTGRIIKKVSSRPMTKDEAENILKTQHWDKWVRCEAIPQPVTMIDKIRSM